jgi:hypothetical protein
MLPILIHSLRFSVFTFGRASNQPSPLVFHRPLANCLLATAQRCWQQVRRNSLPPWACQHQLLANY